MACYTLAQSSLKTIEKNADGTFEQRVVLVLTSYSLFFLITEDEELIIAAIPTQIDIFNKDSQGYGLIQTLAQGNPVKGLALSADGQELISCNNVLNVYRHNGVEFILSHTIALGFNCFEVNFLNGLLEVHGSSSQLHFYELNGDAYVPKFTIPTNETYIQELNIFEGGS